MSTRPTPVALLVPFFLCLAAFWLVPLLAGFWSSLESDTLYGSSHFVGLRHYQSLAGDGRFLVALGNTALHALLTIAVVAPVALLVAHLLEAAHPAFLGAIRFCLLLPGLTPPLVLAILFMLVFSGRYGLLNGLVLEPLGLPAVDWIKDPRFIRISLLIQAAWRWTGIVALFLHAGLTAIPRSYYEIARAEGAGSWRTLRDVTLPLLGPVLLFVSLLLCLDAFVLFSGAYVLLGGSGGTADAGLLLVTYMYQTAFSYGRFGSAAAMAFSIVPLLALLLWAALRGRFRAADV